MADRFESLSTFVAVAQYGSISKASERLRLAKSAVSRKISELESRLGVLLLSRTTRSMRLTEAGAEFLERAVRILEELDLAESVASQKSTQLAGTLKVTAPMSFGTMHLAPLIGKFLELHPDMKVDLNLNDRIVDLVHEGYDVAIRISRYDDSALIGRKLAPIDHLVIASPAYLARHGTPKNPNELRDHIGLHYANVESKDYWTFRGTKGSSFSVSNVKCALSINNGCALREAAIAGHGIAILPDFIVYKAIQEGKLTAILGKYQQAPISMYAVYPANKNVSAKIRVFIEFLLNQFKNGSAWKSSESNV